MKKLVILGLSLFMVACSSKYSTIGENLYLKSQNSPVLEIPKPLSKKNISYFYKLPLQNNPNPAVNILPPTLHM